MIFASDHLIDIYLLFLNKPVDRLTLVNPFSENQLQLTLLNTVPDILSPNDKGYLWFGMKLGMQLLLIECAQTNIWRQYDGLLVMYTTRALL